MYINISLIRFLTKVFLNGLQHSSVVEVVKLRLTGLASYSKEI